MKNINKILTIGLATMALASCADDLNTEYLGQYITTEDKESVLEKDPGMAQAAVTGAFATFSIHNKIFEAPFDFGYPCIMLGTDLQTEDFACKYSGYNWMTYWEAYSSPTMGGTPTNQAWHTMYNQIFTANAIVSDIPEDTDDPVLQFYLANGFALRAFDYFQLVQLYAFNYETHKADKCVPIITDKNQVEAAENGAPRATVEEVYNQITTDINKAVELLEKSGLEPDELLSSKPKRMISKATAYGLRARINLVMHNYAAAAEDADKAITSFTGRPYTKEEVSKPTFTNIADPAWMWGIAIAETDRVVTTGIENFPSFSSTFSYGYVQYGAWKYCGYGLYQQIPSSDVRYGWFLNDEYKSDHLDSSYQAYVDQYIGSPNYSGQDNTNCIMPQTNVKFGTYNNVLAQSVPAADIPLMRIEEMILTKAEGLAMSGNLEGGRKVLEDWVKNYRNSKFFSAASTPEQLQEECLLQRRIELWGEGIAYFDVMRLNRGVNRVGARFPSDMTYNIEPGDKVLIYCVPRSEVTANQQISEAEIADMESSRPLPVQ